MKLSKSEQEKVSNMRRQGFGYRRIAKFLDLDTMAVKYYLDKMWDGEEKIAPRVSITELCPNCGLPVIQPPHKRKKIYCSNKCRLQAWHKAIITKSISRFARNTVTLLETVRSLKMMGIDVYFEEQNIHTMSADGELMLTILASYAQEESRSVSENMKWRIKKNFEEGLPWNGGMLGYRLCDGVYTVIPEEAEIVKQIFLDYLSGKGTNAIANGLNRRGVPTRFGERWHPSVIGRILRNYTYTGNLLLQRTYRENHITKKTKINHGELPQYHVEDAHEPIIDIDTFNRVQEELESRAKKYGHAPKARNRYPFSGLLVCGNCGKSYRRKVTVKQPVWICATFATQGKAFCASKQIPDSTLAEVTSTVADVKDIEKIVVYNGNRLEYHLVGGQIVTKVWQDRSRSESWTEEMRDAVRQRNLERRAQNG